MKQLLCPTHEGMVKVAYVVKKYIYRNTTSYELLERKKRKFHNILTPFLGAGTQVRFFGMSKKAIETPRPAVIKKCRKNVLSTDETISKISKMVSLWGGSSPSLAGI